MDTTQETEFDYQTHMKESAQGPSKINRGTEAREKRREAAEERLSQSGQLSRVLVKILKRSRKDRLTETTSIVENLSTIRKCLQVFIALDIEPRYDLRTCPGRKSLRKPFHSRNTEILTEKLRL